MFSIYGLIDPRDYTTRYVGISRDVYRRFVQHMSCVDANALKNAWIEQLKELNLMVIMQILGTAETYEEAVERETDWIHQYQLSGGQLFNKKQVIPPFVKKGTMSSVGRKSTYEYVRKIVIGHHTTGQWPTDLSDDMKWWYQKFYFTRPNRKKDGTKYALHKRSYERGREWIADHEAMIQDAHERAEKMSDAYRIALRYVSGGEPVPSDIQQQLTDEERRTTVIALEEILAARARKQTSGAKGE